MGIRIALLGPESTGKSTICEFLAEHFSAIAIPEYVREHPESLPANYSLDHLLKISEEQFKLANSKNENIIFEDTEQINIKVWIEERFGLTPRVILERIAISSPDFYLLTAPDIPWVPDSMRENPHLREYLFNIYKAELMTRKIPFEILRGSQNIRKENAFRIVNRFLDNQQVRKSAN